MLHCTLDWTVPRVPVALSRDTFCPREAVCAVAYSQFSPEPPATSSSHCWRLGVVAASEAIAQKEVTGMPAVSFRQARSLAGALCKSGSVHACEPEKFVLQAELAPGSPSVKL